MQNAVFKKSFVVGIIVLFICISFKPVLSNEVTISTVSDINDNSKIASNITLSPNHENWNCNVSIYGNVGWFISSPRTRMAGRINEVLNIWVLDWIEFLFGEFDRKKYLIKSHDFDFRGFYGEGHIHTIGGNGDISDWTGPFGSGLVFRLRNFEGYISWYWGTLWLSGNADYVAANIS